MPITADVMLEGQPDPNESYTLTYTTLSGKVLTGNLSDYIGEMIRVTVLHDCSGNSCWGRVKLEDKVGPVIDCPDDFTVGTDLYAYDVEGARLQRVVAMEDGTTIDIVNLATGQVMFSNTLNRMQSWNGVNPGDGIYFKVEASKPVAAYFTDLQNHNAFVP